MDSVTAAIAHLEDAGVLAYPTETLWGLGADAFSDRAVAEVFRVKGRDFKKPLSLLVSDIDMASDLVYLTESEKNFVEVFWPGPVTFVLPVRDTDLALRLGAEDCVGLRCSPHPAALDLVQRFGRPITSTSANPSGAADGLDRDWLASKKVPVFSSGPEPLGHGSTVLQLQHGRLRVLREGVVPASQVSRFAEDYGFVF